MEGNPSLCNGGMGVTPGRGRLSSPVAFEVPSPEEIHEDRRPARPVPVRPRFRPGLRPGDRPDLGRQASRLINERLAEVAASHPDRFVRYRNTTDTGKGRPVAPWIRRIDQAPLHETP